MRSVLLVPAAALCLVPGAFLVAVWSSPPAAPPAALAAPEPYLDKKGDEELANLLVKLVAKTRGVMFEHYTRAQSAIPGVDFLYKRWLARNGILPAAVAGGAFHDVVPGATGGRAWVRMVVDEPRNPKNEGDAVARDLLLELRGGAPRAERGTSEAVYYAEPIRVKKACLPCHGDPKGEPDPVFPRFLKEGWKDGEVAGAVVARVAPEG